MQMNSSLFSMTIFVTEFQPSAVHMYVTDTPKWTVNLPKGNNVRMALITLLFLP